MKLRVRGNSIRLRLNRGEVAALGAGGRVEERVPFGPGVALAYVFEAADVPALVAHFDGARIVVQAPRGEVAAWAAGDDVGMEHEGAVAPDETLRILVEKDFACLTGRPGEEDHDAFDNPHGHC